jgi:hypothetical protein
LGIVASVGLVWFRFAQTDNTRPRADRLRSLLRGQRYVDPQSPSYDPGFFGRQVRLLLIGLPLIGFALLFVWFMGK